MAKKPTATPPVEPVPEFEDTSVEEVEIGELVHRPDGYHWQTADGKQEFGPFATLEAALADMQSAAEEGSEVGESIEEAEDELGISDWVDPDTGELAEGYSTPHLSDE